MKRKTAIKAFRSGNKSQRWKTEYFPFQDINLFKWK